jgi:ceramide glucosyltransferase
MIVLFIVLSSALVWLSYRSFRGGRDYLEFFKRELTGRKSNFTPFVTVVTPCRGIDLQLKENLNAVIRQEYPAFEVIFVVDDMNDPAVSVINGIQANNARLVLAPKARNSSQKVENLRVAVLHAHPDSEVFAFVDSDGRPSISWLQDLVGPLSDPLVGATTGYRWFVSSHASVASELRSVWNASIASALGPRTESNFCWGGSMAISRRIFEELAIRDRWEGSVSDDFMITRVIKDSGLKIVFVPGALTASEGDCTFLEMLEFTTRQMKLTRVYARHLWINSLLGSAIFVAVMSAAAIILVFSAGIYIRLFAAAVILLVCIFSIGKAWLRLEAVRLALPGHVTEVKSQRFANLTLWLFTPAIFLYNSVAALFSRRIVWRGITYELKSPTETVIIPD